HPFLSRTGVDIRFLAGIADRFNRLSLNLCRSCRLDGESSGCAPISQCEELSFLYVHSAVEKERSLLSRREHMDRLGELDESKVREAVVDDGVFAQAEICRGLPNPIAPKSAVWLPKGLRTDDVGERAIVTGHEFHAAGRIQCAILPAAIGV